MPEEIASDLDLEPKVAWSDPPAPHRHGDDVTRLQALPTHTKNKVMKAARVGQLVLFAVVAAVLVVAGVNKRRLARRNPLKVIDHIIPGAQKKLPEQRTEL